MPTLPYSLSIQTGSKKVAFYPNKWDELCEFDLIGYELRIFGQTKMNFKTHITFTLLLLIFGPRIKKNVTLQSYLSPGSLPDIHLEVAKPKITGGKLCSKTTHAKPKLTTSWIANKAHIQNHL